MADTSPETGHQPRGQSTPSLLLGAMLVIAAAAGTLSMPLGERNAAGTAIATTPAAPVVVAHRDIHFAERADGTAAVLDARDRAELAHMPAGEGGFVRATLRLLVVERRRNEVTADLPFRLTRWSTGRLTIDDAATRSSIELKAFGATNVEAFAKLLETRRTSK